MSGTWTRAGSPYCVTEDLTVGPGSLTIESGVQVRVAADVSIRVTGALVVQGTPLEPVLFTSATPGAPWSGLFFDQAALASSLDGCRIEGANEGGVRILDSAVSLLGCEIADNARDADGAGLWASIASGDLVLQDCRITGNTATGGDGGGLWVSIASGDLVLMDCEVSDNTALVEVGGSFPDTGGNGGGLSAVLADGDLRLERCELSRNRALQDPIGSGFEVLGGGLRCAGASEVVLSDCLVAQNECFAFNDFPQLQFRASGGGIYVTGAPLRLTRCIVRDNRAAGSYPFPLSSGGAPFASGGGLCHEGLGADLVVQNSVFAGNVTWGTGALALVRGGAIWAGGDSALLTNTTVARNQQVRSDGFLGLQPLPGSGIHVQGTTVATVLNSIVFRNTAAKSASALPPGFPPSLLSANVAVGTAAGAPIMGTASVRYSDVEGGAAGAGNLSVEPLFAGGGTACGAVEIVSGSSCVDAGDPAVEYDDVSFPPSLGTSRNDLGANGGPHAAGWSNWARPALTLAIDPRPTPCSTTGVTALTTGGAIQRPVALYLEAIDGVPLSGGPLLVTGPASFCAAGRWETPLALAGACASSSLTFRSRGLDATGQLVGSNAVVW